MLVTVPVHTSTGAKDAYDASKNVSSIAASKDNSVCAAAGVDTADSGVNAPTATKPTSSTVNSVGKPVVPTKIPTTDPPSVPANYSAAYQLGHRADLQATDALAAEALDATEGAFTIVADAIEAGLDCVTPSGLAPYASTADPSVDRQTV